MNPVPSNTLQGTRGMRMPGSVFTELAIVSLTLVVIALGAFVLCLFTQQNTMIAGDMVTLVVAGVGIVCFITQDTFLLGLLALVSFVDFLAEIGLGVARIVIGLGFCWRHDGCLEAFIPYMVLGLYNFFVGFIVFLLFFQALWVIEIKERWDKLNDAPQKPKKPEPVHMTIDKAMNAIFEAYTGMRAPTAEDIRMAKIYNSAGVKATQAVRRMIHPARLMEQRSRATIPQYGRNMGV